MNAVSLRRRAVAFTAAVAAVAFVLSLLATSGGRIQSFTAEAALIPAIVCATLCWVSAERHIVGTAGAVDAAIERLNRAAAGDLKSPIPPDVHQRVPALATTMTAVFRQLAGNLETVEIAARIDAVTGLPNRAHFLTLAEERLASLAPRTPAALLFLDLDRFKTVNDTLGHAAGDVLLEEVARRLRRTVGRASGSVTPDQAIVGRLSGDEFVALLDGAAVTTRDETARAVLAAIQAPQLLFGQEVSVSASIGVADWPDHGADLSELMRAADAAMYAAKSEGRGRVQRFDARLAAAMADRLTLEKELRVAVEQDAFGLVFQPQVAANGRLVGAEALLRWHHPDGTRLPGSFIAAAEDTGLILEIGERVVTRVAATIARWHAGGIAERLSINISSRQLDQAGFLRRLRDALRAAKAPAAMIELELAESLVMSCSEEALETLNALRGDGANITIDNFGTGYTSLQRLRRLPLDRIKLDSSVTQAVAEDAGARAIAQSLVGLAHGLGCTAAAGGVETIDQAEVLRVIGCDVLQGYAIAPPMEEVAFFAWARGERAPSRFLRFA